MAGSFSPPGRWARSVGPWWRPRSRGGLDVTGAAYGPTDPSAAAYIRADLTDCGQTIDLVGRARPGRRRAHGWHTRVPIDTDDVVLLSLAVEIALGLGLVALPKERRRMAALTTAFLVACSPATSPSTATRSTASDSTPTASG